MSRELRAHLYRTGNTPSSASPLLFHPSHRRTPLHYTRDTAPKNGRMACGEEDSSGSTILGCEERESPHCSRQPSPSGFIPSMFSFQRAVHAVFSGQIMKKALRGHSKEQRDESLCRSRFQGPRQEIVKQTETETGGMSWPLGDSFLPVPQSPGRPTHYRDALEESEEDGSSEHRGEDQFISLNAKQAFFRLSFSRHPREAHPPPGAWHKLICQVSFRHQAVQWHGSVRHTAVEEGY